MVKPGPAPGSTGAAEVPPAAEAERGQITGGLRFLWASPVLRASRTTTATISLFRAGAIPALTGRIHQQITGLAPWRAVNPSIQITPADSVQQAQSVEQSERL
jgi:hypothetical protein